MFKFAKCVYFFSKTIIMLYSKYIYKYLYGSETTTASNKHYYNSEKFILELEWFNLHISWPVSFYFFLVIPPFF